jgi:hypothetical protein
MTGSKFVSKSGLVPSPMDGLIVKNQEFLIKSLCEKMKMKLTIEQLCVEAGTFSHRETQQREAD